MSVRALGLLAAVALLSACGGARPTDDGRSTAYRPGLPDFDLDARVVALAPEAAVEALVSVPRASLAFTRGPDSGYVAVARVGLRLSSRSGEPLASASLVDTVRAATFAATFAADPLILRQRLPAASGTLVLDADVEDVGTGEIAMRRLAVDVPPPGAGLTVGAPRLAGRAPGDTPARPLLALAVPAGLDALLARVDVFGEGAGVTVRAALVRLRADTSIAEGPSMFTPLRATLRARGVDVRRPEPVASGEAVLSGLGGVSTAEVALPGLSAGVYRVNVTAVGGGSRAEASRTFVVRRPGFPRVQGIAAFVEPLAYIATPREMRELDRRAALGSDSARAAFDAFWGSLFRERQRAAAAFRSYYERVEEANRLFSTYTDGWKTDRGMVYVLFGPPDRVEDRFDTEVWVYGASIPGGGFTFERTARREGGASPFDVWTLARDRAYDPAWRRALRLWRSGDPP